MLEKINEMKKSLLKHKLLIFSFCTFLFLCHVKYDEIKQCDKENDTYLESLQEDENYMRKVNELVENFDSSKFSDIEFSKNLSKYLKMNINETEEFNNDTIKKLYDIKRKIDDGKDLSNKVSIGIVKEDYKTAYIEGLKILKNELIFSNPNISKKSNIELSYGEDGSYILIDNNKYKIRDEKLIEFTKALEEISKQYVYSEDNTLYFKDLDSENIKYLNIITDQLLRNFLLDYKLVDDEFYPTCETKITYSLK